MRWLYHVRPIASDAASHPDAPYAPASLAREGFVHASFRAVVAESARLYFPAGAALEVVQIDPRRLDVRVEVAATPRGPMPHIHGAIPRDAIHAVLPLERFTRTDDLPDLVTG